MFHPNKPWYIELLLIWDLLHINSSEKKKHSLFKTEHVIRGFKKTFSDVEVKENEFLHIWLVGKRIGLSEHNESFLGRADDLKVIVCFVSEIDDHLLIILGLTSGLHVQGKDRQIELDIFFMTQTDH